MLRCQGVVKVANIRTTTTKAVASYEANPFGLYDMHGNVAEICNDLYLPDYYQRFAGKTAVDPRGPTKKEALSFWQGYAARIADEAIRVGKLKAPPKIDWDKAVLPYVIRGGSFG